MRALFLLLSMFMSVQVFADSNLSGEEEFEVAGQVVKARFEDEGWRVNGTDGISKGEKAVLMIYEFEKASAEVNFEVFMKASDKCIEFGKVLDTEVEPYKKDFHISTNRFIAESSINRKNEGRISQR